MDLNGDRTTAEGAGPASPLAPSLERRRVRLYLAIVIIDVALVLLGFLFAGRAYLDFAPDRTSLLEAQLLLPLYLTLALYQGGYSIRALEDWHFAASRALMALGLAAALLIFITFYAKVTVSFSRVVFTGGIFCSGTLLAASRWAMTYWLRRKWGPKVTNTLVIVSGGPAVELPHAIHVSAQDHGIVPDPNDPHALDKLGRYFLNMDRVVVSCAIGERRAWASVLRAAGVRGELVSSHLNSLNPIGLTVEDGWSALIVATGPLGMRQRAAKRAFDIALSLAGLILLAPVFVLTALAILIEDGRPVLFMQRRLGRGNRFFRMAKFRSMRAAQGDADGSLSASREDERVTRVGRFIRRTSIDELPQLFNVLRGDMSLVGPRPHALGSQAGDKLFWEIDGQYWHRHSLKPGVTGLAQIRGLRGATDQEADLTNRLSSDLEYIRDWSLWRDALIVARTAMVVIHPRAY